MVRSTTNRNSGSTPYNPLNRNRLETELAEMLREVMVATDCNEICYCLNDLLRLLTLSNVKAEKAQVRNIVIDNWKLTPASNALTYQCWDIDCTRPSGYSSTNRVGRFYRFSKSMLDNLFYDEMLRHINIYIGNLRITISTITQQTDSTVEWEKA